MNTESKKIAIIAITQAGRQLARKLSTLDSSIDLYIKATETNPYSKQYNEHAFVEGKAIKTIQETFQTYDALACIMASGIVIRAIAPLIEHKFKDPAVLLLDEQGRYVVSLLSGHVGQANTLAKQLAHHLGGEVVITTATDQKGNVGLDTLAMDNQMTYQNKSRQTVTFNMLLAENEKVALYNPDQVPLMNSQGLTAVDAIADYQNDPSFKGLIEISQQKKPRRLTDNRPYVKLVPRRLILGMGCRKLVAYEKVAAGFEKFTDQENIDPLAIKKIVSIELKKDEPAINQLAKYLDVPFKTFSLEDLLPFEKYYQGSPFVKKTVGISTVAQTAAHKASSGNMLTERFAFEGVTFSLGKEN